MHSDSLQIDDSLAIKVADKHVAHLLSRFFLLPYQQCFVKICQLLLFRFLSHIVTYRKNHQQKEQYQQTFVCIQKKRYLNRYQ